jgi:hypothetical protein
MAESSGRPYVGGNRQLDDDPVRRLVIDGGPDSTMDAEAARAEHTRIDGRAQSDDQAARARHGLGRDDTEPSAGSGEG